MNSAGKRFELNYLTMASITIFKTRHSTRISFQWNITRCQNARPLEIQTIDYVIRTNSLIPQKRPIVTLAQTHWNYWTNQRIWVTWNGIDRENRNLSISGVILICNQHKFRQYVATYVLRVRISHNYATDGDIFHRLVQ